MNWKPIDDEACSGEWVILGWEMDGDIYVVAKSRWSAGKVWKGRAGIMKAAPTHYMPMPKLPRASKPKWFLQTVPGGALLASKAGEWELCSNPNDALSWDDPNDALRHLSNFPYTVGQFRVVGYLV